MVKSPYFYVDAFRNYELKTIKKCEKCDFTLPIFDCWLSLQSTAMEISCDCLWWFQFYPNPSLPMFGKGERANLGARLCYGRRWKNPQNGKIAKIGIFTVFLVFSYYSACLIHFHGTCICKWGAKSPDKWWWVTGGMVGSRKWLKIAPSGVYVENVPYCLWLGNSSVWFAVVHLFSIGIDC